MYRFVYKHIISHLPDRLVESLGGPTMAILSFLTMGRQLPFRMGGLEFPYPVGIPSGWVDTPSKHKTMRRFHAAPIVVKTVTPLPKQGNPYPRLVRGDDFLINSMGLPNKGSKWWRDYGQRRKLQSPVVLSIKADTVDEWRTLLDEHNSWVDMFELNFSCPNVSTGIMDIEEAVGIIREISKSTTRPLLLKLSPEYSPEENLSLVREVRGCILGVSMINTLPVTDARLGNPQKVGGKSGVAIYPVLIDHLKTFREEYPHFDDLPILASGGITVERSVEVLTKYHAIPLMLTTFLTHDPFCHSKATRKIRAYLTERGLTLDEVLNPE